MTAPAHNGEMRRCITMTETAIHTITLAEGSFACIVLSLPGSDKPAAIAVLDRDEVEAHITILRNAMDDAERMDAGKAPINFTPSLRRN